MTEGARDLAAARAAVTGLLASVGFIAMLAWFPARYLADWAVYPVDLFRPDPSGADVMSASENFEMSKWDFRNGLAGSAVMLGWLALIYWLVAYLLGTSRLMSRPSLRLSDPTVLLGAGLLGGMVVGFVGAAPRFVAGPLIDACNQRYVTAHPGDSSSFGIHRCESRIALLMSVVWFVLVLGLMGASLWRRYRLSRVAHPE